MTFATSFWRRRPLAFLLTLLLFLRDTFSRPSATKRKSAPLKATPPSRMRQRPQRANNKKAPFVRRGNFLSQLLSQAHSARRVANNAAAFVRIMRLCSARAVTMGPASLPLYSLKVKSRIICVFVFRVCVRACRALRVEGMRLDGRQRPGSAAAAASFCLYLVNERAGPAAVCRPRETSDSSLCGQ